MKLSLLLVVFIKLAQGYNETPNFVILDNPKYGPTIYVKNKEPINPTFDRLDKTEKIQEINQLKNKFPTFNPEQYERYSSTRAVLDHGDVIIEMCEQQAGAYPFADIPEPTKNQIMKPFPPKGKNHVFCNNLYIKPILLHSHDSMDTYFFNLGSIDKVPPDTLKIIFNSSILKQVPVSIFSGEAKFVPPAIIDKWGQMMAFGWASVPGALLIEYQSGEINKIYYNGGREQSKTESLANLTSELKKAIGQEALKMKLTPSFIESVYSLPKRTFSRFCCTFMDKVHKK